MITLVVLLFILFFFVISINNMKESVNLYGEYQEAMPMKEAFKDGFITMPTMIVVIFVILAIFVALVTFALGTVLWLVFWILQNMP